MLFQATLAVLAASLALVSAAPGSLDERAQQHHPKPPQPSSTPLPVVNQTTCNGNTYAYNQLAGYGFVPSNARDKFGDTMGGFGSAIAFDESSWQKTKNGSYTGILWVLPDRGWNTEGTTNYQNRLHKFGVTLTPQPSATVANPSGPNVQFQYLDSVLFTGPDGTPTTGLDADVTGFVQFPGFPILPVADYTGDGFGGNGTGGRRITVDSEGLVLAKDGTFWVGDEYGPYIYHFDSHGKMIQVIQPPAAYLPQRNDSVSFSADSPPIYNPNEIIVPANTVSGRDNNQGFEGLTVSPDGRTLYALMQSALDQEGGPNDPSRLNARFISYDISGRTPKLLSEHVVTLPVYTSNKGKSKVAAQSEIHYLTDTQFLVLSRDSGSGHGQSSSLSLYRHADIFDVSGPATNINKISGVDAVNGSIASATGVLNANVTPAQYCSFLDFNVNSQLNRFGVYNGGAQSQNLLNEKWESLATVPVNPGKDDGEYFLFSLSDNDFITQDGFMLGGKFTYADDSGYNLDNQALVFQISVPKDVKPS
ncbi:MAG: hypothetical protein MMC33_004042 [Icmadophila ericetorum]|nr:hypothetical protein [Icmadophila ericetorum]